MCLLSQLADNPDDQACTDNGQCQTNDPAAPDVKQIADEAADKATDDTENGIADKALVIGAHDFACNKAGKRTNNNFNDQFNKHSIYLTFRIAAKFSFELMASITYISGFVNILIFFRRYCIFPAIQ